MKYLRTIMVLLILCVPALAEDYIVTEAEYIVISGNVSDTLGRTRLTPDSMRIVVNDSAGTELFDDWFNDGDATATLNGDILTFFDQWEDINGAASVGIFHIMVTIASDGQGDVDLFSNYNYTLRGVTVGVNQTFNEVGDILDTLQAQDDWVAQEGSLIDSTVAAGAAQQALEDVGYNSADSTIELHQLAIRANSSTDTGLIVTGADNGLGVFALGAGTGEGLKAVGGSNAHGMHSIGTGANDGFRLQGGPTAGSGIRSIGGASGGSGIRAAGQGAGHGIDIGAGATGNGIDIDAATGDGINIDVATAGIGLKIDGGGTSGNAMELTSTDTGFFVEGAVADVIPDWTGGGAGITDAQMAAIADSTWDKLLPGVFTTNGSAGKLLVTTQASVVITDGTAQSGGATYIVLASATSFADDILNGNAVEITGGSGAGQVRHIHDWTSATDSVTLHAGNNWTTNPDATSEYEVIPAAAVEVIHLFDSAIADIATIVDTLKYGGGVWVDDGANTNTVVGVDGIPTNPVGTIAAAKTIADAIGVKRIYFVEGTNETIGETMEHYEFIGIGATHDVAIDFGDQDLDGSKFTNVYLSGIQAGTEFICADQCVLDGVDSLEIHAHGCAIIGPISVRGGDSYFDQCYSTVAGSGTPDLDFDGDAAAINVSVRHYSGGLQLLGMTSNHTISYESDGQLVINADCTSGNVVTRGMMTITDNGTTTNLTRDAVFSRQEADLWVWANVDTAGSVDTSDVGDWFVNNISGAAGGLDTLSTVFVDRLTGRMADTTWLGLLAARDGVAGSFGDSAQEWKGGSGGLDTLSTAYLARLLAHTTDSVWKADFEANDGVTGSFADSAQGWSGGAAGDISDADMIAIIDTLMNRLVSDDTTAGAGFDKAFADFLWRAGDTNNWASLADVWRNQDSGNVDTSDIGDWLIANLSGAAGGLDTLSTAFVNRLTGRNADSIWKSLLSARDDVAGSFGDSAQEWKGTGGLTKEAIADAVLDTMEAGTRQIQYRSLTIDSGTVFASTATGTGLTISGGASSGSAVSITTTVGDGINIRPGNGDGIDVEGASGSAVGVRMNGPGGSVAVPGGGLIIEDTLADGEQVAFMPDDFTAADSAGYQGSASGLDSTTVAGAAQQALEDVGYNSADSTIELHQLAIRANSSLDTALIAVGADNGQGAYFGGAGTGDGIKSVGAGTAHGLHLIGTGGNDGIRAQGGPTGSGIRTIGGASGGYGIRATGTSGLIDIRGTIIAEDTLSDGERVAFMPDDFTAADSAGYQGSAAGLDSTAVYGALEQLMADSQGVWVTIPTDTTESGYAVSSQGFGPDTLVLYFNDTSGTDTPIGDVFFSIQNSVGTPVMAFASETATGKRTVHLSDGSYTVVARKTGYIYESYALTASGNNDSVEVAGYNRVVGTSGNASVCRMYGYTTDVGGNGFKNVRVTASLETDTYDSCANIIVFNRSIGKWSESDGYFFLDLIYSSCLSDEKYEFTFEKKGHTTITKSIDVPDSTTHYIQWDN